MGPAEKTAHRPQLTEAVRRAPVPAGVTRPAVPAPQRIQRCAGNRAAGQLLAAGCDGRLHRCGPVPCNCSPEERLAKEGLARYLPVSHPAEPAEREADEVADRVMRDRRATVRIGPAPLAPSVHRHAEDTAATPQAGPDLAGGIARHVRGGGQALDAGVRQFMEARFGRGFGDVRVHTDAAAGLLAAQVDSYAFTVGRHIFFAPGRYRPEGHDGRRLLAHELTHVVQQDVAGLAPAVRRQARPGGKPPEPAPVPAEKFSGTLESAYRRLGDTRRAAAIRMCRERGGAACSIVLTQGEVRRLYELAQQSGGDEQKIRAGLASAAPAALGVAPAAAGLTTGMLTPGIPPTAPLPPFLSPPAPAPPVGVPGYPTWAPPPPVAPPPAAEVAAGEVAEAEVAGEVVGGEVVGGAVSVAAVSAVAVAALVVVCALSVYEAWQFSKFESELEAKGFIVLDDALAVCTRGCHATAQPIRPYPDLDLPFRQLPEFRFPGRPVPLPGERFPWPDIEIGGPRRRPGKPGEEDEEPEEPRKKRRRDRRRRKDQGPEVDVDPRTGEPREQPKDPCDLSPFHSCDGGLTFEAAHQIVSQLPGFEGAPSSGVEPVRDGACWVDGRPRTRDEALAVGATHQTWNLPDIDVTIKCCPCCIRGGTGATGMNCTIH